MAHIDELVYPFFIKCCIYTDDIFWKFVFEDLAYGKTPYGIYLTKNFLCCNYKGKEFSYKIDSKKNPQKLFNEVYDILHKKFGLLSKNDKVRRKKMFEDTEIEIQDNNKNWRKIRKKSIKQNIIEKYSIDKKNKYNLSNFQMKRIFSIVVIGLIFKTITFDKIVYSDGKISDINGISFSPGRIIVSPDIYNINSILSPEIIINENNMSDNWDKYFKSVRK
jgi:hypothetical protein